MVAAEAVASIVQSSLDLSAYLALRVRADLGRLPDALRRAFTDRMFLLDSATTMPKKFASFTGIRSNGR